MSKNKISLGKIGLHISNVSPNVGKDQMSGGVLNRPLLARPHPSQISKPHAIG